MNKPEKKKYRILLAAAGSIVLVLLLIIFLPLLFFYKTTIDFYQSKGEETFISNREIVKSTDFPNKIELKITKFDLFNPVIAVVYRAENYKGYKQAIIADYFYLDRINLVYWDVKRYETSYMPYYQNQDETFEQAYESFKNDVFEGKYSKGLTPSEEKTMLESASVYIHEKDKLLDFVKSQDGKSTIEIRAGENFGENYLVLGETKRNLNITNVTRLIWSQDGKYIIYSSGKVDPMTEGIHPNADIWASDLNNDAKVILTIGEFPNDINFYSSGNVVYYCTKNKIGRVNIDGTNNQTLMTYETPVTNSEDFKLAQIQTIDDSYLFVVIPNKDYLTNPHTTTWKIPLNGGAAEKQ